MAMLFFGGGKGWSFAFCTLSKMMRKWTNSKCSKIETNNWYYNFFIVINPRKLQTLTDLSVSVWFCNSIFLGFRCFFFFYSFAFFNTIYSNLLFYSFFYFFLNIITFCFSLILFFFGHLSFIKNIKQTAVTNIMEQRMLIVDFQIYFKLNVSYVTTYIFRSDR